MNENVERLSVIELPPKGRKLVPPQVITAAEQPSPPPPPLQPPPAVPQTVAQADQTELLITAYRLCAKALSARALLLIALLGAFMLAAGAMIKGGVPAMVVLGLYTVLTVIPIVVLELRGK
jgi:hypothetical protein